MTGSGELRRRAAGATSASRARATGCSSTRPSASTRCCLTSSRVKTAVELRAAFAARELSPVEIVDAAAEHAELGAFVTLTLETRPRGGQARRAGLPRRHRAPARGPDARRQGPLRHRGRRDDLRLAASSSGHVPDGRRVRGQARQGRRRDRRRQDAHARVRLGHHVRQPALPAVPQPVGPGADPGRLERRQRGRARHRRGGARARHRHRRLDPHPRRVLRRLRPEADLRPDPGRPASSRSPARSTTPARWRARPPTCGCFYEALAGRAHGGRRATRIAVCPDLHLHPLDARHPARVRRRRAGAAGDVVEVGFEDAERIYPAFVADPDRRGRARPRRRSSRRAGPSTARTSRRASSARATVTLDEYVEATADARAHARGASPACSPPPTCC